MHDETWNASRLAAALARLEDTGRTQPAIARTAGVSQSTVNRWSRGKVQPGYAPVRRLALAIFRKYPDLARELVEASGYAWAEPSDAPEPDVLADEFGEDTAARLRRVLGKRGEAGADVLRAIEDELRSPREAGTQGGSGEPQGGSERSRAAG